MNARWRSRGPHQCLTVEWADFEDQADLLMPAVVGKVAETRDWRLLWVRFTGSAIAASLCLKGVDAGGGLAAGGYLAVSGLTEVVDGGGWSLSLPDCAALVARCEGDAAPCRVDFLFEVMRGVGR